MGFALAIHGRCSSAELADVATLSAFLHMHIILYVDCLVKGSYCHYGEIQDYPIDKESIAGL